MFSEIERFEWSNYQTAYGNAVDIPSAIVNLKNAETEEDANNFYWKIDNVVILQGSLYSAALPAVSCILDIITEATDCSRPLLLELLCQIGLASLRDDSYPDEKFRLNCLREVSRGAFLYFSYLKSKRKNETANCIDLISISAIFDESLKSRVLWFFNMMLNSMCFGEDIKDVIKNWIADIENT
jgi:hypothetical protein